MKTLFLLRHCEANQFEENVDDHEKKLNERGIKDATLLNGWFLKNDIHLDYILSSSAIRTLETTRTILQDIKKKIHERKKLYLCGYKEIIEELKVLDNNINKVLVVGHEPSISECLNFFISSSRPDLTNVANSIYPAGGLSVLHFNIKNWLELDEKLATLDAFISPKHLIEDEKQN